jgi:uncharacterized protein (DUF1499 family)
MGSVLLFSLVIALVVGFFALQVWARTAPPPELGTAGGILRPCPKSPNCVETRAEDPEHAAEPLPLGALGPGAALDRITEIVTALPRARVTERRDPYLAAEFRSRVFGFTDDVEFLVDADTGLVHFRSASRLGHADMGANRARMEEIRRRWTAGRTGQ